MSGVLRALAFALLLGVIGHLAWPPVYAYPRAKPFAGDDWYNPYADLAPDAGVWLRANFHAHTRVWGPLPPHTAPLEVVRGAYRELGHDAPAISNYMSITPPGPGEDLYVSAYEHGYGWRKRHRTVIGAERVDLLDFPLFQSTDTKQYLLDRLRPGAALLVINHPNLHGGYSRRDLRRLTGYDGIELRSRFAEADRHWDTALSAGRLVFGYCSDDTRKYTAPRHSGIGWVDVHARERTAEALLEALRRGRFVGVFAPERRAPNGLVWQRVEEGRLRVRLREPADEIRVIGRKGRLRLRREATDAVELPLPAEDGYLRVHAITRGTDLFLQPVVRGEPGRDPLERANASVLGIATGVRRAAGAALALAASWALFGPRRRRDA